MGLVCSSPRGPARQAAVGKEGRKRYLGKYEDLEAKALRLTARWRAAKGGSSQSQGFTCVPPVLCLSQVLLLLLQTQFLMADA